MIDVRHKQRRCVKLNSSRIHLDIGLPHASALQANIPSRLGSYSPCLIPYDLFQYKNKDEHAPCPYRKNDLLHAPDFAKVPIPIYSRRQRNISLYKKEPFRELSVLSSSVFGGHLVDQTLVSGLRFLLSIPSRLRQPPFH